MDEENFKLIVVKDQNERLLMRWEGSYTQRQAEDLCRGMGWKFVQYIEMEAFIYIDCERLE